MLEASHFVETIEQHQGFKIACLEEIALYNGWLTKDEVFKIGNEYKKNGYGQYLLSLVKDK